MSTLIYNTAPREPAGTKILLTTSRVTCFQEKGSLFKFFYLENINNPKASKTRFYNDQSQGNQNRGRISRRGYLNGGGPKEGPNFPKYEGAIK